MVKIVSWGTVEGRRTCLALANMNIRVVLDVVGPGSGWVSMPPRPAQPAALVADATICRVHAKIQPRDQRGRFVPLAGLASASTGPWPELGTRTADAGSYRWTCPSESCASHMPSSSPGRDRKDVGSEEAVEMGDPFGVDLNEYGDGDGWSWWGSEWEW